MENKYQLILDILEQIKCYPINLPTNKNSIYESNQLIINIYKNYVENKIISYIPKAKPYNSADLVLIKNNSYEYLQFKYKINKTFSFDKINNLYYRYIENSYTNKLILSVYNNDYINIQEKIINNYNNPNVIFQNSIKETNNIINDVEKFKHYMLKHMKNCEKYEDDFLKIENIIIDNEK